MNRDHASPLSAALPVALCLLLAACGNKGDLFMPPPEPAVVDDAAGQAPSEPTGHDEADAQPPPPDPTTDPILDPAIEIRSDAEDNETLPATESPVTPLPPPPDDEGEGGDEGP